MRVYVASSHRNKYYKAVVRVLQEEGHLVYDFTSEHRRTEVTPEELGVGGAVGSAEQVATLKEERVQRCFIEDLQALDTCDACVLVLPSGRSSHIELGYAVGTGAWGIIYMPEAQERELMYGMADLITDDMAEIVRFLHER